MGYDKGRFGVNPFKDCCHLGWAISNSFCTTTTKLQIVHASPNKKKKKGACQCHGG